MRRSLALNKTFKMKQFFRSFTLWDYMFFAICGIAYFFLIRQYLIAWDDLDYRFIAGVEQMHPVSSWKDIFTSQIWAYHNHNGRFLLHCVVQLFCGFGGVEWFYIVSSIVFIILLLSCKYLFNSYNNSPLDCVLFLALCYVFLPQIGSTFFGGVAWVCNYMYSSAIYLCFYAIYMHCKNTKHHCSKLRCVLLFCFGVFAGCWQESFSIGIAGALLIYHLIDIIKGYRIKENQSLFLLVLGFGLGAAIGIFAPGNFARLGSVSNGLSASILTSLPMDTIMLLIHYPIFLVLICITIISIIKDRNNGQSWSFIKNNAMLYMAILISVLFSLLVVSSGARQYTMSALFSIILLIRYLYEFHWDWILRYKTYIITMCVCFCMLIYVPQLYYKNLLHASEKKFLDKCMQTQQSVIVDSEFEEADRIKIGKKWIRDYLDTDYTTDEIYGNTYFTSKISKWITYGEIDTICKLLLPEPKESIVNKCIKENNVGDYIYHSEKLNYYILCLPSDMDVSNASICFTISPNNLLQHIKYKILGNKHYNIPLDIPAQQIRNFSMNNNTYYVFTHHILYNSNPKEIYFLNE